MVQRTVTDGVGEHRMIVSIGLKLIDARSILSQGELSRFEGKISECHGFPQRTHFNESQKHFCRQLLTDGTSLPATARTYLSLGSVYTRTTNG